MINQDAVQKILGIEDKVYLSSQQMSKKLNIAFSPYSEKASKNVKDFSEKLKQSLKRLNSNIVPVNDVWEKVPQKKRIKRLVKYGVNNLIWLYSKVFKTKSDHPYLPFKSILKLCSRYKIKKGISIVCIGEQSVSSLPMQYISNFKTNSIITIVDFPNNIDLGSKFQTHFDTAMSLFAYHMTNIVLAVDSKKWMVYNFNASHPIYKFDDGKFDEHILNTLIPKILAPICPHVITDFKISETTYDVNDSEHKMVVREMQEGAILFDKTGLYPKGKNIDDLPFRHNLHRIVGKLHLDNRNGMSFGFIAHQMPTQLSKVINFNEYISINPDAFIGTDYYFDKTGNLFIILDIITRKLVVQVPEVWVMTLRSGSDKTHFNPDGDLIKIGLKNGKMQMQIAQGFEINETYKPSFDTKVILAHAVGNAIVASIYEYLNQNNMFVAQIKNKGVSLSHWHGYFNPELVPPGVFVYGKDNPHVSCSSPQSAIYALDGKLKLFLNLIKDNAFPDVIGDIHVEPHHGVNFSYPRISDLAQYILNNPKSTELGNRYLQ